MNLRQNLAWPLIISFLIVMVWMPFEGNFRFVITVGLLLTLLWAFVLHPRAVFLNPLSSPIRLAAFGGIAGLAAPAVVLALMVLKTGVHAHGPEFTPFEIIWVTDQFLIWSLVGGLLGLGIGFLNASRS